MVLEADVKDLIAQSKGSGKTFAEFIAQLFEDKFVEIYMGDAYEDVSVEQISTSYPAVFCGKVIGAYRECLIISAAYVSNRNIKLGNLLFINERGIRALNPVDGKGDLQDMLLRSRECKGVKSSFEK